MSIGSKPSVVSPLAEEAIRSTIQITSNTLEHTFDRAFALGLFLISAGFLEDGRRAIHLISQFATTELVGSPASSTNIARSLRERALMFVTAASPTDAQDQALANIEVSRATLDKASSSTVMFVAGEAFTSFFRKSCARGGIGLKTSFEDMGHSTARRGGLGWTLSIYFGVRISTSSLAMRMRSRTRATSSKALTPCANLSTTRRVRTISHSDAPRL